MGTDCIAQGTLLNALDDLNAKAIQKGGDICICKVDSLCCRNIIKQLRSNKSFLKKELSESQNPLKTVG